MSIFSLLYISKFLISKFSNVEFFISREKNIEYYNSYTPRIFHGSLN